MDDQAKAERDRIWNDLKPGLDPLAARITALYEASGSNRTCRLINELWRPENAAVGIGFVPPEARDALEALIAQHGLHLHKGSGPLGKGVYFSFLHDAELTNDRLHWLAAAVEKETLKLRDAPPPAPVKPPPSAELVIEENMARMEGLIPSKRDKPKSRPAEVAEVVDAFNRMTAQMGPAQAVNLLADAVAYFNLPEITIRELQRTLDIIRDAELNG
jgi:hypothetical protein